MSEQSSSSAALSIVVVGSLNMDFVVSVNHLPAPGETVLGRDFQMLPGGKGANQAYAAGRLGGNAMRTRMVGRVGHDMFADLLKASLSAAGVDVSAVNAARGQATGIALIGVEKSGQNSIIVASGANHALIASEAEAMRTVFRGAAFVLFQLETPLDTVEAALKIAQEEGARTILDPAPAQTLKAELLARVDVLTPNESEASILLGRPPGRVDASEAPAIARELRARGPKTVILKLGDQGCYYSDGDTEMLSPPFAVEAVDSTAAGDVFNAAFAIAAAERMSIGDILRFANAAAALSITRAGAQASIPARDEVDSFLRKVS